jgi:hypothetical protein
VETATWYGPLDEIRTLPELARLGHELSADFLTEMADEFLSRAHNLEGPMPEEVAEFIRIHRTAV